MNHPILFTEGKATRSKKETNMRILFRFVLLAHFLLCSCATTHMTATTINRYYDRIEKMSNDRDIQSLSQTVQPTCEVVWLSKEGDIMGRMDYSPESLRCDLEKYLAQIEDYKYAQEILKIDIHKETATVQLRVTETFKQNGQFVEKQFTETDKLVETKEGPKVKQIVYQEAR